MKNVEQLTHIIFSKYSIYTSTFFMQAHIDTILLFVSVRNISVTFIENLILDFGRLQKINTTRRLIIKL